MSRGRTAEAGPSHGHVTDLDAILIHCMWLRRDLAILVPPSLVDHGTTLFLEPGSFRRLMAAQSKVAIRRAIVKLKVSASTDLVKHKKDLKKIFREEFFNLNSSESEDTMVREYVEAIEEADRRLSHEPQVKCKLASKAKAMPRFKRMPKSRLV